VQGGQSREDQGGSAPILLSLVPLMTRGRSVGGVANFTPS
jgi:hypothetical protein